MIITSLPIRPRTSVPAAYLTTVISVLQRAQLSQGDAVIPITTINGTGDGIEDYINYINNLSDTFFHYPVYLPQDSFVDIHSLLFSLLKNQNLVEEKVEQVQTCSCGKYEEVLHTRSYNTRRLKNGKCTYCNTPPTTQEKSGLYIDIPFVDIHSYNPPWVKKDYAHFVRQNDSCLSYKISKESSPLRFYEFGLRHQILWAEVLVYLSKKLDSKEIELHFVHRVKNLAFMIMNLVYILDPSIKIHLQGLPELHLPGNPSFSDVNAVLIDKMKQGVISKKKVRKFPS